MDADRRDHFLERAEEELKLGEAAATKCAADAHFELAGRYFDLAYRWDGYDDAARGAPPAVIST